MNRTSQIFALILLLAGALALGLYQRQYALTASGGEPIKVLTFVKAVERDKVITDEMIVEREVPQAYVEDRAVKDIERAKVTGLHLAHPVQAGETVMWTDLVTTAETRTELSSLIAPGSRAVSVKTSTDSSSALILPGDYVDIIGVVANSNPTPPPELSNPKGMHLFQVAQQSGTDRQLGSIVLVQRVLVLAAGVATSRDDVPMEHPENRRGTTLTLALTLPEAQLVALAADRGHISVALRNREDARTAANIPDLSSRSLLNSKEREDIRGRRVGSNGAVVPGEPEAPAPAQ